METNLDIQVLEVLVKALVEYSDEVRVERSTDEMGVLLSLTVNPNDMGKVIGKEGNTAKAMRTILRAIGLKNGSRINLKIVEPEGSQRPRREYHTDKQIVGE